MSILHTHKKLVICKNILVVTAYFLQNTNTKYNIHVFEGEKLINQTNKKRKLV